MIQPFVKEAPMWARFILQRAGQGALVVGNSIYVLSERMYEYRLRPEWQRHELKHVEQYQRYGIPGFLVRYFYYQLRYGYHLNPLEIEAREAERT